MIFTLDLHFSFLHQDLGFSFLHQDLGLSFLHQVLGFSFLHQHGPSKQTMVYTDTCKTHQEPFRRTV